MLNKKIFLIVSAISIMALAGVLFIYLQFLRNVVILNKSNTYYLAYYPSSDFADFFNEISNLKTNLPSLKHIRKITIIVNDSNIPTDNAVAPLAPVLVSREKQSTNNNLVIYVKVDPSRANSTPQKQLNDIILINVVSYMYIATHFQEDYDTRKVKINNLIKEFYLKNSNPFVLKRKN